MTELLASGFSSFVYETPDGKVRRVPRTPEAREACLRQCRFLPRLAAHLPVPIPVPSECEGAMVYPKLQGEPLQPEMLEHAGSTRIAHSIAEFMAALHSIPVADALSWGVPAESRTAQLLAAADRVLPLIPLELRGAARTWRDQFVETPHRDVLIHGDLWYENILVDLQTGCISGVVDFDATGSGDAAWDLATQLHCGEGFAKLVFDAYPFKDATFWDRAEALFRLRPFEGLDWAARNDDAAEFEDGLRKLHEVGVLPGMIRSTTTPWLGTSAE